MIMRKEIIKDIKFKHSYNTYTLSRLFTQHILRKSSLHHYLNPATSKVPDPHTRHEWTTQPNGKSSHSLIVINDSRQEIAQVGERALLTTSLIFDELLNCNRGGQNYEYERNKFFIQDATNNAKDLGSPSHILTLDVLWYMVENNLDAVEMVIGSEESRGEIEFLSKRYGDILGNDMKKAQKVTPAILKPLYQKMVERFKEEDGIPKGGSVKWDTSFYRRDWNFEGVSEQSPQIEILKEYYRYRHDTEDKPAKQFVSYVKGRMEEAKAGQLFFASTLMSMIAHHFGYIDINDADYFTGIALTQTVGSNHSHPWRKVADSAFKRNSDWHLDSGNFIKSEVLKLRRQMEEGTFDE